MCCKHTSVTQITPPFLAANVLKPNIGILPKLNGEYCIRPLAARDALQTVFRGNALCNTVIKVYVYV